MVHLHRWRAVVFFLLTVLAHGAVADEVVLKSGDRVRGEIVSLSAGKLVVRTQYAGELALRWSDVASLSTSRPVTLMREGERAPLLGVLQPLDDGRVLLLNAAGGALELRLDQVAHLNPQPWESGLGAAYSGRLTLSAAYSRGNTEDERFNGDGEFTARAREYRYALAARIDHRDEAAVGRNTAWLGNANYDRFVDERRFFYTRASLEHDRAKDVERRSTLGGGYGAQIFDTQTLSLSVRAGLDYVRVERLEAPNEGYPAFGWGVKATWQPWFHEQEGFWNLEDTEVITLRSKTGLRLPLLQGLGLSVQLNLDWERRPAPGRKSTDSTLLVGVDYAW
jgi:putative salt-induced outer membrane protein YdiY